jgi:flavin reductase (DIM6/NTAB) family NADH-FMN oxidoreductase RutF
MFYDTARRDHGMTQDPLTALIVPRPIGWISTLDGQGRVNLAPYSFYNAVSASPPMVYFSTTGTYGDNPTKHSRRNAEETGEFVVNMVSAVLAKQMNITTSMVDYGIDEMKRAGAVALRQAAARRRIADCARVQVLEDDRDADRGRPRDAPSHGGVRPRRRHPCR